jgi:hypothetical protein
MEPVAFTPSYSCFFFKKNGGPSLTHFYSSETVRRDLPFFRRRARTFRPFLVLIRFRNPWSRFLFKFEGFRDVNDMIGFSFRPFSYELSILWVNGMRVKRIFDSFTRYGRISSLTGYGQEDIVGFDFLAFFYSIEQELLC